MKSLFKKSFVIFSVATLTACNHTEIEGSWVEPIPGMPDMVQGFTLEKGGKATSINMATLQYEKWEQKKDQLILSGKSIGNRTTISFSDTLVINKLTQDSLTLKRENITQTYARRK